MVVLATVTSTILPRVAGKFIVIGFMCPTHTLVSQIAVVPQILLVIYSPMPMSTPKAMHLPLRLYVGVNYLSQWRNPTSAAILG
jgi:hypothetical protein